MRLLIFFFLPLVLSCGQPKAKLDPKFLGQWSATDMQEVSGNRMRNTDTFKLGENSLTYVRECVRLEGAAEEGSEAGEAVLDLSLLVVGPDSFAVREEKKNSQIFYEEEDSRYACEAVFSPGIYRLRIEQEQLILEYREENSTDPWAAFPPLTRN